MKSKLILGCAIAVILLCLPACSSASQQTSIEIPCDDFYKKQHITEEAEVAVDGSFTVTLCSNPTTGFQWSETAVISDQTVLQQTGHKLISPADREKPPPPGTPSQEVWTFKTLKKGMSTISLEYSRPWEGGEKSEWTFVLNVVAK